MSIPFNLLSWWGLFLSRSSNCTRKFSHYRKACVFVSVAVVCMYVCCMCVMFGACVYVCCMCVMFGACVYLCFLFTLSYYRPSNCTRKSSHYRSDWRWRPARAAAAVRLLKISLSSLNKRYFYIHKNKQANTHTTLHTPYTTHLTHANLHAITTTEDKSQRGRQRRRRAHHLIGIKKRYPS